MTPEELVAVHLDWADGMARSVARRVPRSFQVDDLIQQARLGLWRAAQVYDEARNDNFCAFAHPYVQGAIWMSVRRRHYREATHCGLTEANGAAVEATPVDTVYMREIVAILAAGVAELEPREAAVIRLHYTEGLSMPAVALRLGLGETWTYQIRKSALRKLYEHCRRSGLEAA